MKLFTTFLILLFVANSAVAARDKGPELLVVKAIELVLGEKEVLKHERANFSYEERAAYIKSVANQATIEIWASKLERGLMTTVSVVTLLSAYLSRAKYISALKTGVGAAQGAAIYVGSKLDKLRYLKYFKYAKYGLIGLTVAGIILLDAKEVADATQVGAYLYNFENSKNGELPGFLLLPEEDQLHFLTEECIDYTTPEYKKKKGMLDKCERLEKHVTVMSATLRELLENYYSDKFENDVYEGI